MSTTDLEPELLLLASARLSRWASRSSPLGLPVAAARLLGLIEELQPVRVSTLAHADQTSQPTMTTHVQRLERSGLVERGPDAGDARVTLVTLTAAGAATLAEVRRRRAAVLSPYLADMTSQQRSELVAATSALVDLLERIEHTDRLDTTDRIHPSRRDLPVADAAPSDPRRTA